MSNPIGGYFGLELQKGEELHKAAIKINTGRNALEYILKAKCFVKIYLPYYACDVLLQPFKKLNIEYAFYSINESFEAIFDFNKIKKNEALLYINYFGLKDNYLLKLKSICRNLIVDNAQAFYSTPLEGIDTFYSPRKFFGVPDGAYLYTNTYLSEKIDKDVSHKRFEHLLRRADINAEDGFPYFTQNEKLLDNNPILKMSNLTNQILQSIDYTEIAHKRRKNFEYLHQSLKDVNELGINLEEKSVPMIYPFLTKKLSLKQKLVDNRIYTATYWPNVLKWVNDKSIENQYVQKIIPIPIDQRYGEKDFERIIKVIKN